MLHNNSIYKFQVTPCLDVYELATAVVNMTEPTNKEHRQGFQFDSILLLDDTIYTPLVAFSFAIFDVQDMKQIGCWVIPNLHHPDVAYQLMEKLTAKNNDPISKIDMGYPKLSAQIKYPKN